MEASPTVSREDERLTDRKCVARKTRPADKSTDYVVISVDRNVRRKGLMMMTTTLVVCCAMLFVCGVSAFSQRYEFDSAWPSDWLKTGVSVVQNVWCSLNFVL